MPKQKIDLQNLLAKYQNNSKGFTQQDNFNESRRQMQIEQSFYGKRTIQQPQTAMGRSYRDQPVYTQQPPQNETAYIGNFKMSKQQCENFLLQIQAQLQKQKKQLSYQAEIAYKEITERFNRNHERIRKQLLQLLDAAFKDNERQMKQQLMRQSKSQPTQFNNVKYTIQAIDQQVMGYLRQLRSADYRKAISQVVLKDYSFQMKKLRDTIDQAKTNYIQNLGEIEPDVARIECLRNDLKHMFYFKKKTAKVIEKSIFSVLVPKNQPGQQGGYANNESRYAQQQQQAQSRTRKSFFNFGN